MTRVCSYDRAGMGWSEARPGSRDARIAAGQPTRCSREHRDHPCGGPVGPHRSSPEPLSQPLAHVVILAPVPYPAIEPNDHGLLDVGDGNLVYWEISGNPRGKPAVVVHGGPGSGSRPESRRFFHPERYRIIQFDQRGCGRSLPHAGDPATEMSVNTTHHLIADMERLREHLGVERWLLFGGSWGSTLSLAYAEQYPRRVSQIVLAPVTTGRHSEIHWLYYGVRRFFPEAWEEFRIGVPTADQNGNLVSAYARLMEDPEPAVRIRAARNWCAWEDAVVSQEEQGVSNPYGSRPDDARLAFVRICSNYLSRNAWLEDDVLFRNADRLAGIPGVLLHGRVDLGGPAVNAWELSQVWPDARLTIFDGSGHLGNQAVREELVQTLDQLAQA
jgi:proline iminopeptidase